MSDTEKIVVLDAIRIERHRPRKCTCEIRKFTVDTVNREVTCGCGMVVDPFEAMEHLAKYYERVNRDHESLNEQRKQWIEEKPHSILFKDMERHYRRGTMLPHCPECEKLIDFKNITSWGNAEFYRLLEQRLKNR